MSRTKAVLRIGFSLAVCAFVAGACSLVVSTDPYKAGCESVGKKPCENASGVLACVGLDDRDYGCAAANCVPCTIPHANPVCKSDGTCGVGTCFAGWGDCVPGSTQTTIGCETNTNSDVNHCSTCTNDCDVQYKSKPNVVTMRCGNATCKIDTCAPHTLDCDGGPSNGCEQPFDAMHCGKCQACAVGTTCDMVSWTCK